MEARRNGNAAAMCAGLPAGKNVILLNPHVRIGCPCNMVITVADILPHTVMISGIKNIVAEFIVQRLGHISGVFAGGLRVLHGSHIAYKGCVTLIILAQIDVPPWGRFSLYPRKCHGITFALSLRHAAIATHAEIEVITRLALGSILKQDRWLNG